MGHIQRNSWECASWTTCHLLFTIITLYPLYLSVSNCLSNLISQVQIRLHQILFSSLLFSKKLPMQSSLILVAYWNNRFTDYRLCSTKIRTEILISLIQSLQNFVKSRLLAVQGNSYEFKHCLNSILPPVRSRVFGT